MNAAQAIRDAAAKRAALEQYARAHDCFSEQEQKLVAKDRQFEASGAHEFAVRILRAYRAELDDPGPER